MNGMLRRILEKHLFGVSMGASLAAHALLWILVVRMTQAGPAVRFPTIEVDLRTPFRPRSPHDMRPPGAARGIPAPAVKPQPGKTGPQLPALQTPTVTAPPLPEKPNPVPEKEWVLPGPNTEKLAKPVLATPAPPPEPVGAAPGGTGLGGEGGRGGSGGGTGTGEAWVNRPPRLINIEEIRASLRRHYPELERRAGREGRVVVGISIGEDGRVSDVAVLESSGSAFDEAARSVARKMLFEPALRESVPVPSKVRQVVVFQLDD